MEGGEGAAERMRWRKAKLMARERGDVDGERGREAGHRKRAQKQ